MIGIGTRRHQEHVGHRAQERAYTRLAVGCCTHVTGLLARYDGTQTRPSRIARVTAAATLWTWSFL
jgi:hypothetical protein